MGSKETEEKINQGYLEASEFQILRRINFFAVGWNYIPDWRQYLDSAVKSYRY
jgi:hypothetical protein